MDTEFLVVAGVAVVLLVGLFNLLIIASLAGKLSRVQEEAKQQEKLNHDLYRAVSTLYSQNKQVLDLENQATHVLGTVSGHTQQMLDDSRKIHGKLEAVSTQTTQMLQFDQDLNKELGKVQEATRHIISIKDDISSLQNLLRSSRKRGRLGEVLLSALLEDVLPAGSFALQHQFASGTRADAVIKLDRRMVAVDSKFPLTNYEHMLAATQDDERARLEKQFARDVRKHVDDIATKYIIPGEGTLDFALMFIPSEAVFYEIVTNSAGTLDGKDLITYAFERHVFPVSPNTFYPYLLTIARGLRQLHVADNVKKTIEAIAQLEQEFVLQVKKWETARQQIDNARRNLGEVQASLDMIHERMQRIVTPNKDVIGERSGMEVIDS